MAGYRSATSLHFFRFGRCAGLLAGVMGAISCSVYAGVNAEYDHVIHVSVDGLRGDLLDGLITNSPGSYDSFRRFVNEGATTFNARTDYTHTVTVPNHATMITGRPVDSSTGVGSTDYHGYTNNLQPGSADTLHNQGNPNVPYVASAFGVVHDRGGSTALYASKSKFVIFEQSYNALNGGADTVGMDNGKDKIDTYVNNSDSAALNTSFLSDMAANQYDYAFIHYLDPDVTGHDNGWGSTQWDASVQTVDGFLGAIMDMVETTDGLTGSTAVVLTSDHGGANVTHSNPTVPANYTIPMLVWDSSPDGVGVIAGADLYGLNIGGTRLDPGTLRPGYDALVQPIRNGDSGNLALDLLGLPAIDGSFINSDQDLVVTVIPEPTTLALLGVGGGWMLFSRRRRVALTNGVFEVFQ